MAFGAGPFGSGAVPGPTAPTYRPTWLLVLSSLTLIYGGLQLIWGLRDLRNPTEAAKLPIMQPLAPQQEAMMREWSDANTTVVARHTRAIRGRAAASMVLALFLLYSAAAALSRDRHGRTATLTAAGVGIVYWLGCLPLLIPIADDYAATAGPVLARIAAAQLPAPAADADGGAAASLTPSATNEATPPEAAATMHALFLGYPIATAILGVLVSLLLISYFGGRRGRALYGLAPTRPPLR